MMASDYSDNKNGQKNRIYFWLKHEVWSLYEAALLFADINPDSVKLKNDLNKFDFLRLTSLKGITYDDRKANLDECMVLLNYENTSSDIYRCLSGKNESDTPQNWIDLAISKQFTISWQEVIEQGVYMSRNIEKPLKDIERNSLLIIIAALAKDAKVDIDKISKAGEYIAGLTDQLGASVSPTTIERHLKKIKNAIESRTN
jgi:hypothetical protein